MARSVAIIAYSFRLPGTDGHNLWDKLLEQQDLITQVDPSRWSKESYLHPDKRHPGSSYTFAAGSIGDVTGFDAAFFGISPREATLMDPQQRLLLELAWETFENGGIIPSTMRGSDCGVFVGISSVDYSYRLADDLGVIDSSTGTGIVSSIAANRISYLFDLHGPSIAMDTACSSSLVAFHQASQAIRAGEISQALTGGINLHLHPMGFISFSKASMLSKTGRCHVFDESGDGYVRSEGGGLFLLKDYDRAVADGDQILAVVAGSAVNTDGSKSGLTVPNSKAQAELMTYVCQRANITPNDIDYLEAHGTGTAVGDPIETYAIGQALGKKRNQPLLIGSIKSNMGHLESASGVAGLVKVLKCIQHRAVPATIGIGQVNPEIHLADWNLQIVTDTLPLKTKGKLTIGVNSFGFGGANAHIILQSPASLKTDRSIVDKTNKFLPLIVTGKSTAAANQAASEMANFLDHSDQYSFYDIAHTAFFRREKHKEGVLVFAHDAADAAHQLRQLNEQTSPLNASAHSGIHLSNARGPAFVYSGNGCQWLGMGRKLLQSSPTFKRTVERIDKIFSRYAQFSLQETLANLDNGEQYHYTEISQPALFALQVGMTEILREHGVRPTAVTGHSVGEVAAAWASGAMSLEDAVEVIYYRSHHQGKTKGRGQMTAVGLGADEIQNVLDDLDLETLHLAGINSCKGVTVAGATDQLSTLETELTARNIFCKRLELDYAFHSSAMDPIEAGVLFDLAGIHPKQSDIPFYSTVTGTLISGTELDAKYWWHNIRRPVKFHAAVSAILHDNSNTFIEVGAHPVLLYYVKETLKEFDRDGITISTLKRNNDNLSQLTACVARTLIAGVNVDIERWFPVKGNFVKLPNYPWQREKFWHPVTAESYALLNRHKVHPLLGYRLPQHILTWENQLDTRLLPFLADHNVGGAVVFPGAGFVEIALAAANQLNEEDFIEIEDLEIQAPLLLSDEHSKIVRFSLDSEDLRFSLQSREQGIDANWTPHLVGRLLSKATGQHLALEPLKIPQRAPEFDIADHLRLTQATGLEYGPAFQTIKQGWLDKNTALGTFTLPDSLHDSSNSYFLHPSLLDCAFQLVFQILRDEIDDIDGIAFVPTKMGCIHLRANRQLPYSARATLLQRSPHSLRAEFALFDAEGNAIALISDARFRAVRLHKHRSQHLQYLDERLTAAPLYPEHAPFESADLQNFNMAFKLNRNEAISLRYSEEIEPLLDSLCNQFIVEALANYFSERDILKESDLAAYAKSDTEAAALLHHLIVVAEENQIVEVVEDQGWVFKQNSTQQDVSAADIWNTLVQEYPDYFYPIHLVGRIGMHLSKLLKGELKAADLDITPPLYGDITRHIFGQTGKNVIAQTLIEQYHSFLKVLPTGKRLNVLEISAGHPEFAEILCPHIDFKLGDCHFFGLKDIAVHHAESLRERFPLLQTTLLTQESECSDARQAANFTIINLNTSDSESLQQLFLCLPKLVAPGSPVFVVGLQPAWWIDMTLGCSPDWWLNQDNKRLSPQLSTELVAEQLTALGCKELTTFELAPGNYSGIYLLTCLADHALHQPIPSEENWLILTGPDKMENSLAGHLSERLQKQGQNVVTINPGNGDAIETALKKAKSDAASYRHILHLVGIGANDADRQIDRCALTVRLIQACETTGTDATCWLLTRHVASTFPADQENPALSTSAFSNDAGLWGFGRSLQNEASNFRVKLLDSSGDIGNLRVVNALIDELMQGDHEQEIFIDATGKRFAPRLRLQQAPGSIMQRPENQVLRLGFKLPGQLRFLHWESHPAATPIDDDIEVSVKATGLNFRDVMYTLGLLSDEAIENGFAGPSLGLEFAGVVTRTGKLATEFAPGDHVVGFGPASFSDRVITKSSAIAHLPADMPYAAAATIPGTFFTVYYALHHLARLQPGEKILIHGAAGGVGIAAIQIAQWLGAEIYATAGSNEKRDFLRLLGIEHIHDSRSLSFAEEILRKTENRGIDVVLNSLAGEAINRNLKVLKPFGRFLELGKRDFYENTRIGLRPFRNNISYFGIDADQLMQERPELTRQLFGEMMQLFHKGILHPLPYTTFDANQVTDAFRYMQLAKHIGKIVITYDNGIYTKPVCAKTEHDSLQLSSEASYLVTGGLNGLGLRSAEWLVEKGARHLILISRSGPSSDVAKEALAKFAENGVNVLAEACDICDKAALSALLETCKQSMPPLHGIIHSAAVIDDGMARNLDTEQIRRVLQPKILGALNLHELTLSTPLDLFVVFSSATTLFGNPGQSNYVAANFWLEAFASHRRQQKLPATCIRLGAIDDVGFLSRNDKIKEAMQNRMGGGALSSHSALEALEQMLLTNANNLGVIEFEWRALSNFLPMASSPKYHEIAAHSSDNERSDEDHSDIERLLNELSDDELQAAFIEILKKELSQILLISEDKIDPDASMYDMGLDSLMGVELMVAIESRFDVQIPVMALSEGPTLNKLSQRLVTQLQGSDDDETVSATENSIADLSSRHATSVTSEQVSELAKELQNNAHQERMTH